MNFIVDKYTTHKVLSNQMSFIEQMRSLAIQQADVVASEDAKVLAEKTNKWEQRMKDVKQEKFKMLNEKYFDMIERKIKNMSAKGRREAYINFDWDDFKANCNGLGNPRQFQRLWIDEITNPDSIYLPKDEDGSTKCLEGLHADIWGNGAFTTHFTW
jgi:hypothetical protein